MASFLRWSVCMHMDLFLICVAARDLASWHNCPMKWCVTEKWAQLAIMFRMKWNFQTVHFKSSKFWSAQPAAVQMPIPSSAMVHVSWAVACHAIAKGTLLIAERSLYTRHNIVVGLMLEMGYKEINRIFYGAISRGKSKQQCYVMATSPPV